MEAYQQRVVDEKTLLDEKIEKLESFMTTVQFENLKPYEKDLLSHQLHPMIDYSRILGFRINAFEM